MERVRANDAEAGSSGVDLNTVIMRLGMPVTKEANPKQVRAQLEEQRRIMLLEAKELAETRQDFDRSMREFDAAHKLAADNQRPSRMKEV